MKILLRENPINQPFDEQGIEKEHEAAQDDQGHAEEMRAQERSQLASKPAELRVAIRSQGNTRSFQQSS